MVTSHQEGPVSSGQLGSNDVTSGVGQVTPEVQGTQFALKVLRVDGLPHRSAMDILRKLFGKSLRFSLNASDGVTTKETQALRSRNQSVVWNEMIGHFIIDGSSRLVLRLFAKRKGRSDLVGTVEVPFEFTRLSSLHPFDMRPEKDALVKSNRPITIRVEITVLDTLNRSTPADTFGGPDPVPSHPSTSPVAGQPTGGVPSSDSTSTPALEEISPQTLLAEEALDRADETTSRMTSAPGVVKKVAGSAIQTPDQLSRAGDLCTTWGVVIDKISGVVDVLDKVSELHPYAKMAWSILSFIPKTFLDQIERDDNVRKLLQAIHDAFDLLDNAKFLQSTIPNSKQTQVLLAMMRHICDCAYFIQTYARNERFRERLWENLKKGVDEQIEIYRSTLKDLEEVFLRHGAVNTEATVFQVRDSVQQISGRLEGIFSQLEEVSNGIADVVLDAKIAEIPYGQGSRFDPSKGCLFGTRKDFLDYIADWVNNPGSERALVLFGQAGTGKSSIAHEAARRFSDMGRLCTSYIFVRGGPSERNSHFLLTTLVRDLCDHYPSFRAALGHVIKSNTSLRLGATDYRTLFDHLLLEPFKNLHLAGPILVIIDALDESGDVSGNQGLHTFLAEHLHRLPSNFRFFITARPEKQIEPAFLRTSSTQIVRIDDSSLAADADNDILAYCLQQLPGRDRDARKLAGKAEGSFQWAAVACKYVQNVPDGLTEDDCLRDLLHPMTGSGPGRMDPLDTLYHTVLASRFNLTDGRVRKRYQSVMGQLLAVFEPHSIDALTSLRTYAQDNSEEGVVLSIVGGLGSLLSNVGAANRSFPVVPFHTSFRDFLMNKARSGELYVDIEDAHRQLAHCCLGSMKRHLKVNICKLLTSHKANRDIADLHDRISKYIPYALLYGGRFWDYHLDLIHVDPELFKKIRLLLEVNFLPWLEFLSVTGHAQAAAPALLTVRRWLSRVADNVSIALSLLTDSF
ncbi:hypothetical protein BC834DRAFT_962954 [Gloeopeniophorella convolvens]|nr:hypothetical protein BC834DRAFT_962954 [Gloeopeniophorella convolvens]